MQGTEAGDLTQTPAANRPEKVFVPSLARGASGGGGAARTAKDADSNISKISGNETTAGITISVHCNHILEQQQLRQERSAAMNGFLCGAACFT